MKCAAKVEAFNVQSAWSVGRFTMPVVICQGPQLEKGGFQNVCVCVCVSGLLQRGGFTL